MGEGRLCREALAGDGDRIGDGVGDPAGDLRATGETAAAEHLLLGPVPPLHVRRAVAAGCALREHEHALAEALLQFEPCLVPEVG